jgi:hypothetical protein
VIKITATKEQHNSRTTENINVTNMEPNRRRLVLIAGMNRNGFSGVIKDKQNNQTVYVFIYEKAL